MKLAATLVLIRDLTGLAGTFGRLFDGARLICYTLEPPWMNNEQFVSCIPPGVYRAVWQKSPGHGWCYGLLNVPGRTEILFHAGNYLRDTEGCILPGLSRAIGDDLAVGESGVAMSRLRKYSPNPIDIVIAGPGRTREMVKG